MAEGDEIYGALHCDAIDQSEFEQVLGTFFGHGQFVAPNEVRHGRDHGGCAIRAIYDGDGRLTKVLVGPDGGAGDVEALRGKIEECLLASIGSRVCRQVLFANVPVIGSFRFEDLLQIGPVPPEAPKPPHILGHHPFLLECMVQSSSDPLITGLRHQRIGREIELFLSSLTNQRVWGLGSELRKHWCLDWPDGAEGPQSKFLQEGYTWQGVAPYDTAFSSVDGLSEIGLIEPQSYYAVSWISMDSTLTLPSDLPAQLSKFRALPAGRREQFLRASYWFQHAGKVLTYSKSASFVALVSAIEALMAPPSGGKQCPECKQTVGPGAARQFIDFVEQLIPGSGIPDTERRRFYRLRSSLSHGGKLLAADHGSWGFTPKQISEDYDARVMWQIVRHVMRNWLASR